MSFSKRLLSSAPAPFVASENFKVVIYTGNGASTHAITGVGFQPDWVWIANRSSSHSPKMSNSSRGSTRYLYSNQAQVEQNYATSIKSFDADGFTLGTETNSNQNGLTYVAWCWKVGGGTTSTDTSGDINSTVQVNADAGISIATYVNNGNNSLRVGHGLGVTPKIVLIKKIEEEASWHWMTTQLDNSFDDFILNTTAVKANSGLTAPTSTTFAAESGGINEPMICFALVDVAGFSKYDTYTGNGSTNGPVVNTGFEPAYVLIKNATSVDNWVVFDNARNTTNPRTKALIVNDAGENTEVGAQINFYSNGFQSVGTGGGAGSGGVNKNNNEYIYMAFAADPDTEAPTVASSFNIETWAGNARDNTAILGIGFQPDMVWYKTRTAANDHNLIDSIRGATFQIRPDRDIAQVNATDQIKSFDSDGLTLGTGGDANANGQTYVAWIWKGDDNEPAINTEGTMTSITRVHANAGFSIVQFTNSSPGANARIGHGLSTTPNMIFVKRTDGTENWYVYHSGMVDGNGSPLKQFMRFDLPNAQGAATNLFNTVNATVFNPSFTGTANQKIMAYCFHDVTGYQKFGSYTGNGNAGQAITTGFKPDFVMIKSTYGTSNWTVYDTRRSILAGMINPDNSDTETTDSSADITITATGFSITSGGVSQGLNSDTRLYIYWAIAKNVPSNTTLANSFKTVTWSGNNSARTISGMGFNPDLLWIKARNASEQHYLYDKLRGASKFVHSNITAAEGTDTSSRLRDFTADGFKLGTDAAINGNNNTYVAWGWKAGNSWESNIDGSIPTLVNANTANGFSVIKYDMNITSSTAFTIGHGLSSAPELVIFFSLDQDGSTSNLVYPNSPTKEIAIDSNSNGSGSSSYWNNTAPSTTVINMGTAWGQYSSYYGGDTVAYAFHSVSGYSKIGSYTGNGSAQSITGLGFQPDFIMIKSITTGQSGGWHMYDSERGAKKRLKADESGVEYNEASGGSAGLNSFDSNGFTMGNDTDINANTHAYLYMAFKEN